MSKSLARVRAAAKAASLTINVREMAVSTRSAQDAANALACGVDQIAKSIVFRGAHSDMPLLFLTAGGNRVDDRLAMALAGEPLERADAAFIRARTGFAIGGVAPIGHLSTPRAWFDPRLMEFETIWAAAGTPHHLFCADPASLKAAAQAELAQFAA